MSKVLYGNKLKEMKWQDFSIVADMRGGKVVCYKQDGGDYWKVKAHDSKNSLTVFVGDYEDLSRILEDFSGKSFWEIMDKHFNCDPGVNWMRSHYDGGILKVKNCEYFQDEMTDGERFTGYCTLILSPGKFGGISEKYDFSELGDCEEVA